MSKNWSSQWITLSDMMTWLMLVFLLISILFIAEVKKNEENKKRILVEYNNVKSELYKDLKKAFEEKESEWNMTIQDNLTVKFNNDDVLFLPNNTNLTNWFKIILDDFIPKYLDIITNNKYNWKISEIRIEWHAWNCPDWTYFYCLELSQWRSNSVLKYILNSNDYIKLDNIQKSKLNFLFTSNWMSNWKNLDKNLRYSYISWNGIDSNLSRRVEFRIVANTDELVDELISDVLGIK